MSSCRHWAAVMMTFLETNWAVAEVVAIGRGEVELAAPHAAGWQRCRHRHRHRHRRRRHRRRRRRTTIAAADHASAAIVPPPNHHRCRHHRRRCHHRRHRCRHRRHRSRRRRRRRCRRHRNHPCDPFVTLTGICARSCGPTAAVTAAGSTSGIARSVAAPKAAGVQCGAARWPTVHMHRAERVRIGGDGLADAQAKNGGRGCRGNADHVHGYPLLCGQFLVTSIGRCWRVCRCATGERTIVPSGSSRSFHSCVSSSMGRGSHRLVCRRARFGRRLPPFPLLVTPHTRGASAPYLQPLLT